MQQTNKAAPATLGTVNLLLNSHFYKKNNKIMKNSIEWKYVMLMFLRFSFCLNIPQFIFFDWMIH